MTAPTFIQEAETSWNTDPSPSLTTASFNVLANDVLCASGITSDQVKTITITGGSLTWTLRQEVNVAGYCRVLMWTAIVDADKSMTVTFTESGGAAQRMGGNVFTFRASDGVGASSKTNASGDPTLSLTTTQADSAIVVASGDWNAVDGTSRTWWTGAGTLTEQTYFRDSAEYAVYVGYHANAGAIGSYNVGLDAPGGQKYSIAAVEIKGVASAAVVPYQAPVILQAVRRSSFY